MADCERQYHRSGIARLFLFPPKMTSQPALLKFTNFMLSVTDVASYLSCRAFCTCTRYHEGVKYHLLLPQIKILGLSMGTVTSITKCCNAGMWRRHGLHRSALGDQCMSFWAKAMPIFLLLLSLRNNDSINQSTVE